MRYNTLTYTCMRELPLKTKQTEERKLFDTIYVRTSSNFFWNTWADMFGQLAES